MRFLLVLLFASPVSAVGVVLAPFKGLPEAIEHALNAADSSIDLDIYGFSDTRTRKKLGDAANRGVTVRVILHAAKNRIKLAKMIEDVGGDVYFVTKVMHQKFVICDRKRLLTGSSNWLRGGYSRYDEDLLTFGENDSEFVDAFHFEFEEV
ncbi:phospholipase D-like domain-containing protein [Stieleria varia]|uniref:phospholipase D n=1 Tax=Stieleria varia TaxID=2528005 RepID=A0A5C6AG49_9BACT|nr:phospholipase D-like domain-containing protein [Stieleria varia]TWT98579.1 Phospholipase D precursor [Stieleria varia]